MRKVIAPTLNISEEYHLSLERTSFWKETKWSIEPFLNDFQFCPFGLHQG
jgi:hypothetical protein